MDLRPSDYHRIFLNKPNRFSLDCMKIRVSALVEKMLKEVENLESDRVKIRFSR